MKRKEVYVLVGADSDHEGISVYSLGVYMHLEDAKKALKDYADEQYEYFSNESIEEVEMDFTGNKFSYRYLDNDVYSKV